MKRYNNNFQLTATFETEGGKSSRECLRGGKDELTKIDDCVIIHFNYRVTRIIIKLAMWYFRPTFHHRYMLLLSLLHVDLFRPLRCRKQNIFICGASNSQRRRWRKRLEFHEKLFVVFYFYICFFGSFFQDNDFHDWHWICFCIMLWNRIQIALEQIANIRSDERNIYL